MLFGIDVSHYQAGIDMSRAKSEGIDFAILKVSQGSGSRDSAYAAHRDNAHNAGMIVAAYHMITGDPAAAQAANCKAALGDLSMPLALDWEESGGSGNWANFMAVLAAFRAAGLRVALAYCPRWYFQQQGSPDMSAARLPLWSSRYIPGTGTPTSLYARVTADMWAGYGGLSVALVQFTDRATVAGCAVDCSAFPGTRDQLANLLGIGSTSVGDRVILFDWPPGDSAHKLVCPVGSMSQVTAQAWLSLACDGTLLGYDVWFQSDTAGISEAHGALTKDHRVWWPVPDGCTQITVHYTGASGPVGACIETRPK